MFFLVGVLTTITSTYSTNNTTSQFFTIWLFNIAMENGPFIDDFPIKTSIYKGFSIAMLNNQRVNVLIIVETLEVFQSRDHHAFSVFG